MTEEDFKIIKDTKKNTSKKTSTIRNIKEKEVNTNKEKKITRRSNFNKKNTKTNANLKNEKTENAEIVDKKNKTEKRQ